MNSIKTYFCEIDIIFAINLFQTKQSFSVYQMTLVHSHINDNDYFKTEVVFVCKQLNCVRYRFSAFLQVHHSKILRRRGIYIYIYISHFHTHTKLLYVHFFFLMCVGVCVHRVNATAEEGKREGAGEANKPTSFHPNKIC